MTVEAGLGESSSRDPATDLLRQFDVTRCPDAVLTKGPSGGEVELGLSLGGCFGAEPEKNQLVRASSISGLSMHDDEGIVQPIARTLSLPMESEEENRKREGLQSTKREGLQSLKSLEVKRRRLERRESRTGVKQDSDNGAVDGLSKMLSISQRSVGSQGSSGLSDFDCLLKHGSSSCKEIKITPSSIPSSSCKEVPSSIPSSSCKEVKIPPLSIPLALNQANTVRSLEEDKQPKKKLELEDKAKELERSKMEEMPCVSARGNGPNGRMIQGLLYKYGNGVDVRIVCVCHGSFLTPAEFVKHAGGGDVDHPLRHIVVSHPPFAI